MKSPNVDSIFAGSVPEIYDRYFVPLIFESYAEDLARRVSTRQPARVLEIAAGTGVATRRLAEILPSSSSIIATDLNRPMLDRAVAVGTTRPVEWREADAMHLPFDDGSFDAVICQFGVMFFPDKAKAFAEARRVICPGGYFIFNVWDGIEQNEFADFVTQALAAQFPDDPPRFMARIPHGYHDTSAIVRDLAQGGFQYSPEVVTVAARSRAESPLIPAIAYCQGTPLRGEIEARAPTRLVELTHIVADGIAKRFGIDAVDGKIQAHIVAVER